MPEDVRLLIAAALQVVEPKMTLCLQVRLSTSVLPELAATIMARLAVEWAVEGLMVIIGGVVSL